MLISLLSTHYLLLAFGFFYAIQKNVSFSGWLSGESPFKVFLSLEVYFSVLSGLTYLMHAKTIIFLIFIYHLLSVVFMLAAREMSASMFKQMAELADNQFAPMMSFFYLVLGILTLLALFF